MDVGENPCKISRVSKMADQYPENDDEDDDGVSKIRKIGGTISTEANGDELVGSRLRGWHNSSRIFRVSRASGGKDRHSKVLTSKGLRDRRVRLSVSTAISFYDLQDRLGYDQPSKAVEWLIKAADDAINELPSLNTPFSDIPMKQFSSAAAAVAGDENVGGEFDYRNYQQQISACSSTSETSKGSGLSVSRPDVNVRVNREKARERARERASKEKESEAHLPGNNNNSSFTELLNAGINKQNSAGDGLSLFRKSEKQWQPPSMDYFATGLLGGGSSRNSNLGFSSSQIQLGNNSNFPQSMMMMIPPFSVAGESPSHHHHHHHNPPELQHFSFMPNTGGGGGNENYNLNFSPSSTSSSGFNNRGTLQSNSSVPSSMLPHHQLQRFPSIDGSSSNVAPFFMGTTSAASAVSAATAHLESNNHQDYHQFGSGFDGSLQLYHGDGTRDSDHKGKGKN